MKRCSISVIREMQIKTIMSSNINLLEWFKKQKPILPSAGGIQNGPANLENGLEVSYKDEHILTTLLSNPTPRYLPKKSENIRPHKDVYTNVHSGFIHSSQKLKTN